MSKDIRLCMGCMSPLTDGVVCPQCGFDNSGEQMDSYLPLRTVLGKRYIVGRLMNSNGEGATYLGYDTAEQCPVMIREFFPDTLSTRGTNNISIQIYKDFGVSFNTNLTEFLSLARSLSRAGKLPGIFPVTDIFEENNTAYVIYEYVPYTTLRAYLAERENTISWDKLRDSMLPLLTTLSELHKAGIFHYGISPETVVICEDGKLRFTGFCTTAVRCEKGEVTPQLFPGYAAYEQYGYDDRLCAQTDVYGFAATLFRCLIGTPPPDSASRAVKDRIMIPASAAKALPRNVLTALANAMQVELSYRTQTVDDFRAQLAAVNDGNDLSSDSSHGPVRPERARQSGTSRAVSERGDRAAGRKKKRLSGSTYTLISAVIGVAVFGLIAFMIWGPRNSQLQPVEVATTTSASLSFEVTVPDLNGFVYDEAALTETVCKNLKIVKEEIFDSTVPVGAIVEQDPKPGVSVQNDSTITIKVSKGPEYKTIPSGLLDTDYNSAVKILNDAGFKNVRQVGAYDGDTELGKTVSIDPPEGSDADINEVIYVHVNVLAPESQGTT